MPTEALAAGGTGEMTDDTHSGTQVGHAQVVWCHPWYQVGTAQMTPSHVYMLEHCFCHRLQAPPALHIT